MKTHLLIAASLLISANLVAQTTYVPDDNFEQALIDAGYDSGALDDQVPTANINGITVLDIGGKDIADLTGIEDFTALESLYCWVNNIASIDMSGNPNLIYLEARENQITTVNVSSNPNLEFINVADNNLSNIDVSSNLNLESLVVSQNIGLNSINVSTNTQLQYLIAFSTNLSFLNINSNINLINLDISNTLISAIDLSSNVNLEVMGSIEVPGITNLDLSACTNLKRLWHADGNLNDLILPEINTIEWLLLENNNLTTVDFLPSTNNLELFYLNGNQITEIDLSSKGVIFWLRVNTIDGLASLDIRDTDVSIMYADENPDLNCIFVDDAAWASTYIEYAEDDIVTYVETEEECETLSLQESNLAHTITVFPNPTNGIVNVVSTQLDAIKSIGVLNMLGQKVIDNQSISKLDLSYLPQGIFFVEIEFHNGTTTKVKVIKE